MKRWHHDMFHCWTIQKDGEWVKWEDVAEKIALLDALVAAGVDNWEGFSEAQQMLEEDE